MIRDGIAPQIGRGTLPGMYLGNPTVALNSAQIKRLQPGAHADGGGLYLVVYETGQRAWSFRFTGGDGKRGAMVFADFGDKDGQLGCRRRAIKRAPTASP